MTITPYLPNRRGKMPFAPIERKAAFMAAVTLKKTNKTAAALGLGVSWTHLDAVLMGERDGSMRLKDEIAEYVGISTLHFWRERIAAEA